MSNPTSNFGWQMPTPTDLVTDLPADFEVFGQAVDTSLADLKGGTTGQVLSKTTNADMDFTWVAPTAGDIEGVTAGVGISGGGTSGTVTITNDMATTITASGDIVVGTGSGTYDNLPIGTTGQVLTADTTVSPYKVKWATPAGGGGKVLQVVQATTDTYAFTGSSTLSATAITATITPTLNTSKILILITVADCGTSNQSAGLGLMIRRGTSTDLLRIASFAASEPNGTGSRNIGSIAGNYLDSPATTSATTYNVYFQNLSNAGDAWINNYYNSGSKPSSTITLMEIGA